MIMNIITFSLAWRLKKECRETKNRGKHHTCKGRQHLPRPSFSLHYCLLTLQSLLHLRKPRSPTSMVLYLQVLCAMDSEHISFPYIIAKIICIKYKTNNIFSDFKIILSKFFGVIKSKSIAILFIAFYYLASCFRI